MRLAPFGSAHGTRIFWDKKLDLGSNNPKVGVSINGGTPKWFIRENPIKMDDDWGTPILGNPHVSIALQPSPGNRVL